MRVLGLLSGTSHDGIDAAIIDFAASDGHEPLLRGELIAARTIPYSPGLRSRLIAALPPASTTFAEMCELDTLIGQEFAEAAAQVADAAGGVDAVCSHGQTVYHWVDEGRALGTLQIGQPAWIAERLDVPVVSDVRIRDITAGGHGAPLVSFLDALLLRGRSGASAALNLGGIANITHVNGDEVRAYDIGPANALIDAVITAHDLNDLGYDEDARIARSGRVDAGLLTALLADPYYALAAPKSTGKEHFHLEYVRQLVRDQPHSIPVPDLVRTLTELTVRTVAADVAASGADLLLVSGGGCHNPLIMQGLRDALPDTRVAAADELGAPVDSKEAILFALIGWCTLHQVAATLPLTTGAAQARVLGTITPARAGLELPPPSGPIRGLALR